MSDPTDTPGQTEVPDEPADSPWRRLDFRLPLSLVLPISLAGLLLAAAGVILLLVIWSAGNATDQLRTRQAQARLASIARDLIAYTAVAEHQAEALAQLIASGALNPRAREFRAAASDLIRRQTQISRIAFLGTDYTLNGAEFHDGKPSSFSRKAGRDAQTVALLQEGKDTGASGWVGARPAVYRERDDGGGPLADFNRPVRSRDKFLGLLLITLDLGELSLAQTEAEADQGGFILRGRDQVLAAVGPADPGALLPAVLAGADHSDVILDDGSYRLLLQETERFGSPPWITGAYFRTSTLGDAAAGLGGTWTAIAVALLAAAAGAAYLGQAIARPIVASAEVARNFGEFRAPSGLGVPDSMVSELHHAAAAFNAMSRAFRMMEAYIPTSMLRRLEKSGAAEAEKRMVTVMYSDISNFGRLADFMSARDTAAFLNQHFALVTSCIEAEDGTVDKIVGDGVIAFWGAPLDQPDHAQRATRAAFAVADAVRYDNDLRREQGQPPVQVKIGLHGGPVVAAKVGAAGRLAYTIIGETVNLAQRIQELCKQVAGPDDEAVILAGATTADALGPEYSPVPAGSHVVPGAPGGPGTIDVFRLD